MIPLYRLILTFLLWTCLSFFYTWLWTKTKKLELENSWLAQDTFVQHLLDMCSSLIIYYCKWDVQPFRCQCLTSKFSFTFQYIVDLFYSWQWTWIRRLHNQSYEIGHHKTIIFILLNVLKPNYSLTFQCLAIILNINIFVQVNFDLP